MSFGMLRWLLVLMLAMVFLSGCDRKDSPSRDAAVHQSAPSEPPIAEPAPELLATQSAFIDVSRQVTPAVVNISASRPGRGEELSRLLEDFFGEFFRNHPRQPQRPRQEQSLGSGVIISSDGYILTNEHVVEGAEDIKVKLTDQRVFPATLIGADPRTDVAVLKIETDSSLPTATLGNSDQLQVGQWALAIGNPFGLDSTLTVGVVSAMGRANLGIEDYEDFIQTDASINPGNSGGPLLNIYGEVVGINTAIVASGQGIGFAIPINLARQISDQLIATGAVSRGWLGVSLQPLTPELADSFDLNKVTGALINQVLEGSPAEAAGLQRGDILLSFDGKPVRGVRELQLLVARTPAGQNVKLEILRGGKTLHLEVTISERVEAQTVQDADLSGQRKALGMTVEAVDGGVEVVDVDPQSSAAQGGVQPGDIILSLNRMTVKDLHTFNDAVEEARASQNIVLLVRRGETTLYLAFPGS